MARSTQENTIIIIIIIIIMIRTVATNPNYLAKVVQISSLERHPNADRLQLTTIDHQTVVVGLNASVGGMYVYFPLESAISADLLAFANAFEDKTRNKDKDARGFFNKHGRVRAIRLRGTLSNGYLHPLGDVNAWLGSIGLPPISEELEGLEFDHINDVEVCRKYCLPRRDNGGAASQKAAVVNERLVEGQFRLHDDTAQLRRNIDKLEPDDIVSITYKMHGTNAVFANVLGRRKLCWKEKIAKVLGCRIVETEYGPFYASRRVLKNGRDAGWYSEDIWGIASAEILPKLDAGITLYCEIVGQTPNGQWIQKDYDYGCAPGKHEVYVFRITYTGADGAVIELSRPQIQAYCTAKGLKVAPLLYHGTVRDILVDAPNMVSPNDPRWHDAVLSHLESMYIHEDTDALCWMCSNPVPAEGVVLKLETGSRKAYKLKSSAFLLHETKQLDAGETSDEDGE
jgi:hypothetical protein